MVGETFVSVSASVGPLDSHWKQKGKKEDKKQYKEEFSYNGGLSSQIWRPKDNGTPVEFSERKAVKKYSDPYLSAPLNPKLDCQWKREATDFSDVTTSSTDKDTTSSGTVETCSCCPTTDSSESLRPAISVDHLFQKNEGKKMENSENEKSIKMDSPSEKPIKVENAVSSSLKSNKTKKEINKIGESINMDSSNEITSSTSPSSFDSSTDTENTRLELEKLAQKSKNLKKKMKEIGRKKAVKDIIISDVSSSDVSSFIPMKKIKKKEKDEDLSFKKIVEEIREQIGKKDEKQHKKVDFLPKPIASNICDLKPLTAVKSSSYVSLEAIQINEWSERKYWLLLLFFLLFVYFYRLFILQQSCC